MSRNNKNTINKSDCSVIVAGQNEGEKRKRSYEKIFTTPVVSFSENPILAASIVENSMITSVGQEVGPTFDLSNETDDNTGKSFSHEWD